MAIMERPATPWHLWVIGILALLWNAFGAYDYLMTQTRNEAYMSAFTPQQLEYFYSFPAWAIAFWALGVWGCFFGSVALLLRSRFAVWLFAISVVGLVGVTVFERLVADLPASLQTMNQNLFAAAIWAITIALLIYASRMRRAGVLR